MQVSLPMYDLPELIDAHDLFWRGLRRWLSEEGIADLPDRLDWPQDLDKAWRSPDLLLSQTCGYPLVRQLAGQVQLVGVPIYAAPGCNGINYSSALIVARDSPFQSVADLRGRVAGYNELNSQSGYNALRYAVAPLARGRRFFGRVVETGRHEASIDAVAARAVDIAAIDAVTYALITRYQPSRVAGLRVLGFTEGVAGLPFITTIDTSPDQLARLQRGLARAFGDPDLAEIRQKLLLADCAFPSAVVYDDVLTQEHLAIKAGYPTLA
jgi:ABC-type phosphate/phosphonate transport system substrate-binding protein